jgi:hypothetical protein
MFPTLAMAYETLIFAQSIGGIDFEVASKLLPNLGRRIPFLFVKL